MQNILLAIDAAKPNKNTLDFACYIARLTRSKLTAIFLENIVTEENTIANEIPVAGHVNWEEEVDSNVNDLESKLIERHIIKFKNHCFNEGIDCSIHRDKGVPLRDVLEETKSADILIVEAEVSRRKHAEALPAGFVEDILVKASCPVIIAPYTFKEIDKILFTYDGSKASVFALEQFIHLFPELCTKTLVVLEVKEKDGWYGERYLVTEFLERHFARFEFKYLQGEPSEELLKYLQNTKNIFVVMGAYTQSFLTTLFDYQAQSISKTVNVPIFIAE